MYSALVIKSIAVVLSLAGFSIAAVIAHHKAAKKPLVCPLSTRCDLVTESAHSRFMGIHNEHLGLLYYALVAVLFVVSIFAPSLLGVFTPLALVALPAVGCMFSVYLTLLQAFVIRQWCMWCLGSAAVATMLCLVALYGASIGVL